MSQDDLIDGFEDPRGERRRREGDLVVDVGGFEGPIDVLLTLAREQKVDLVHISIVELADQYLAWVAEARRHSLELAADYLVMAAWLAYLKSRLLLPEPEGEEEPSGEEMAAALAFQLQRLEAMQDAGARLMAMPRRGADFHVRGAPETVAATYRTVFDVSLYELLRAYGEQARRAGSRTMHIEPLGLYSVDDALARFRRMLGELPDWHVLERYLPADPGEPLVARSALAAHFAAALEMVREGQLQLRQNGTFGPIYLRAAPRSDDGEAGA